jgi:hypothetical protein
VRSPRRAPCEEIQPERSCSAREEYAGNSGKHASTGNGMWPVRPQMRMR